MEYYSEVGAGVLVNNCNCYVCDSSCCYYMYMTLYITLYMCCMSGDVVVSVNGRSLAGLSRQQASAVIKNSPDIVDLQILRGKLLLWLLV